MLKKNLKRKAWKELLGTLLWNTGKNDPNDGKKKGGGEFCSCPGGGKKG